VKAGRDFTKEQQMPIINPNEPYTFRKYFDLKIDPIDLALYFEYDYRKQRLSLPQATVSFDAAQLTERIERTLPQILSSNEQTKREMLVSPILRSILEHTTVQIRIEYPLKVTEQLQGVVDYLLSVHNLSQLVVIEAKNDDLDYGFTQLLAEMIALDQWERSPNVTAQSTLLGAVTTGSVWQFATLNRQTKQLVQGVNTYRVPEELDAVIGILLYPLTQPQTATKTGAAP
jgi:hypothetical protein